MANKWLNLILLGGLLCSGTVGTMYGYSYVKDNVKDYLKAIDVPAEDAGEIVSSAYSYGFMGQYAAFVPGMIFDAFGPVVTILTGAGMIGVGYNVLAFGVIKGYAMAIYIGIAMAGMGSKSLGMGSMLGSLSLVDESKVSTLSGIYLGLDASSAIFAVYAFLLIFVKPAEQGVTEDKYSMLYPLDKRYVESQKGDLELLGDFFGWTGISIAIVGCCVAAVYYFGLKNIAQAKEDEKQAKTEEEEALLANGEEVKVAVKGEDVAKTKKSASKKPVEKKTLWSGVVCVYIICLFGESMGLFFNKLTGPNTQASVEYNHVLSIKNIFEDEKHSDKIVDDAHIIEPTKKDGKFLKHDFIVTKKFMSLMQMEDKDVKQIDKISVIKNSDKKYVVTVEADAETKTQTFEDADASEKVVYFTKTHDVHGKVWDSDLKQFKKTWDSKWNVFFLFTMGNAVGRLSFGITSDILAGYKILALTKSFYIMVCCALYIIFFGMFYMIPNLAAAPMQVNALVALIGITYGGIFTMVTAYMKEVCAKNQVGMLLGFALVILAIAVKLGNTYVYEMFFLTKHEVDLYKLKDVQKGYEGKKTDVPALLGENTLKSFCLMALVGNVIALGVSIFMWLQHMQIKKAEIAAAEEAEFTDESDDENEADHK